MDRGEYRTADRYKNTGSHSPVQIAGTGSAGEKLTAASSFSKVSVCCPSWNNNIEDLTLRLYRWDTSYSTTIAQAPVASKTFHDFTDNQWLELGFAPQAPGEYLWVLDNPSETVGVWKHENSVSSNTAYVNGAAVSGDFESRIGYVGTSYYYIRNAQGDIIGLFDSAGTQVVSYTYDTWGKLVSTTGSLAGTVGKENPYRYRGYRCDDETGLFYVGSRYYDPEIGRFINADDTDIFFEDQDSILEHNLFAYCFNNPVNMHDPDGYAAANIIGGIVGGVAGAALGVLLAKQLGLTGWKKWALISAATVSGAALGAFLGPYVAKLAKSMGSAIKTGVKTTAKVGKELCFVAGTPVKTDQGDIPIEQIKAGDYVYAENPETGEKGLKRVLQTFENEISELVHVSANGEEIVTTPGHPFYVPNIGWVGADELKAGDLLVLYDGKQVTVEKVTLEHLSTPVKVYNFEVEDFHTYYVGDSSVLVHNKGCGLNKLDDSYLKKTLKLDAHAIKREYLGKKAKIALYDLAVDKGTGIIYIVDKVGKVIAETFYKTK